MVENENRSFVMHARDVFQDDFLSHIREEVGRLFAAPIADKITPREHEAVARGESIDRLRMRALWYEVWQKPVSQAKLLELVSPFHYVIFPVQVRYVRDLHKHSVPWHQDLAYIRLLGKRAHSQVITCFIPLEENPAECTTIQFANVNAHEIYPHETLDGFGAGIKECEFNQAIHYSLNLGDALFFGDHTIHRTFLPENGKTERRSLEFRLVRREHLIAEKDYFDIKNARFVRTDSDCQLTPSQLTTGLHDEIY